jgi:hypothetical protein
MAMREEERNCSSEPTGGSHPPSPPPSRRLPLTLVRLQLKRTVERKKEMKLGLDGSGRPSGFYSAEKRAQPLDRMDGSDGAAT